MSHQNLISKFFIDYLRKNFSEEEKHDYILNNPENFLIIRQHNQFGDMLASISLFRAIKEKFPSSKITLIASPENYFAVTKNSLIDYLFVFNKKKLFNIFYLLSLVKILRKEYDVAIVPATVAISKTSCILAAFSNSKMKIGPASLDNKENNLSFLFNYRINLNWKKNPDAHVSDFILDIVKPFGITTKNFRPHIEFSKEDENEVIKFISKMNLSDVEYLIGFHVGAGKPQNRWALDKFIKLIYMLNEQYKIKIYFTGSSADKNEISYIKKNLKIDAYYFLNRPISQLAALISKSDLFITNDTGVMHVAGATDTPQISIFGPTNPFNWAPIGNEKYFIRKSELISDVSVDDVFNICKSILEKRKKRI
ncbi:MAG: glycosyltransferase family 9 protein [Melioribacteraceae bacterium]